MDLQKAKIQLEKINALYKSMSADVRNISSIERDLMRSYVLQLYEVFLDLPATSVAPEASPVEIFKPTPQVTLRKPEPPAKSPEPPAEEARPEPAPAPPPVVKQPEEVRAAPPPPPPPHTLS
jgi:hypothetical protein